MYKFAAALLLTLVSANLLAADRRVQVNNRSDFIVVELYASNIKTSLWEEDILGSQVLGSGESARVNIDDGTGHCLFDIKIVFEDGDEAVKNGFNVCTEAELNITN